MSVDPEKKRIVLIVHGVQIDSDADLKHDSIVDGAVRRRLDGTPLDYECDLFRYENMNDKALDKIRALKSIKSVSLLHQLLDTPLDLVGDVVTNLSDGEIAHEIREKLRERIVHYYREGNPVYILAHSLGSIYAFDTLNRLMEEDEFFDRKSRRSWPVQAMLTIGSPIGLKMFREKRSDLTELGLGLHQFRWINMWDRQDPVVSGSFYGKPAQKYRIAESFLKPSPRQGWNVKDIPLDTGCAWLTSHTAYWDYPAVVDQLIYLLSS